MKWKSRRRNVPKRLEPSLSDGTSAEEEGLDRFDIILCNIPNTTIIFQLYVLRCIIQSMSNLQYVIIPNAFIREIRKLFIFLLLAQLARHPFFGISLIGLALGDGCRVGWAKDIQRRYLTFFFCHQTWQFEFYRKKRQWERPLVMTIRSYASLYRRGVNCISSLTWASCLAYLCRRQPRPDDRVSKSCTPTAFFYLSGWG